MRPAPLASLLWSFAAACAVAGPDVDQKDDGADGGASAGEGPVFRRPIGAGVVVDPSVDPCVELDVLAADEDSLAVNLVEVDPFIAGAELMAVDSHSALWRWCPQPAQREVARHLLTLAAEDGDHPPTILHYQIVLRSADSGCQDDLAEDDDDTGTARWIDLDQPVYRAAGSQICSGDDDWYGLYLFAGETVNAAASFEAAEAGGDLDLHVVDPVGAVVVGCREDEPVGCTTNGQSAGSDERLAWEAPADGTYHLVVHGWDGSRNSYDLCVSLEPDRCP